MVFDDINIDLLSVILTATTLVSVFVLGFPAIIAGPAAAAVILPLRLFFPRPKPPQGLVLIVGGSSGIGAEMSYIFAERGHDLILVGRNEEQLQAVKKNVEEKFKKIAYIIASDLSVHGAAEQLYNHVVQQGFTVDVLINSAGLGAHGDTLEQSIEMVDRMTTLNCISVVQLTQLFGRDMVKRGRGWILQISSVGGKIDITYYPSWRQGKKPITHRVAGWMASPGQNLYHATKHYVRAFSEALSFELRAHPGVINTQLMPGPTHTQFVPRAHAEESFIMAASGAMEDPRKVAMVGYKGLCNGKRMVFSSWNAAFTTMIMQLVPRSVHVTLGAVQNFPLRGLVSANKPETDQNDRGSTLKESGNFWFGRLSSWPVGRGNQSWPQSSRFNWIKFDHLNHLININSFLFSTLFSKFFPAFPESAIITNAFSSSFRPSVWNAKE